MWIFNGCEEKGEQTNLTTIILVKQFAVCTYVILCGQCCLQVLPRLCRLSGRGVRLRQAKWAAYIPDLSNGRRQHNLKSGKRRDSIKSIQTPWPSFPSLRGAWRYSLVSSIPSQGHGRTNLLLRFPRRYVSGLCPTHRREERLDVQRQVCHQL